MIVCEGRGGGSDLRKIKKIKNIPNAVVDFRCTQSNVEQNLKSGMTEAKLLLCENCTAAAAAAVATTGENGGGTRIITIIEAVDELDGGGHHLVLNSNSLTADKRTKRGVEAASLVGNETLLQPAAATENGDDGQSSDETAHITPTDRPKPTPTKRDADRARTTTADRFRPTDRPKSVPTKRYADDDDGGGGLSDMTQAIMEQRVDYDLDEEFRSGNGPAYDAHRIRPVNNYRGYDAGNGYKNPGRLAPVVDPDERLEDEPDDFEDGDHNSHYEYVPMEFDDEGNHRYACLLRLID